MNEVVSGELGGWMDICVKVRINERGGGPQRKEKIIFNGGKWRWKC